MTYFFNEQATLDIVKVSEGDVLTAYPDPGTHGKPWTIGYGHTAGVQPGMRITQEQAEQFLEADLILVQAQVLAALKVTLNPNQLGALVSFAYNVGSWRISSVLQYANDPKKWASVPGRMALYRNAGRPLRVMPGLVIRRAKEGALWMQPYNQPTSIATPVPQTVTADPSAKPDFSMKGVTVAGSGVVLTGLAGMSNDFKTLINNVTEAVGIPAYYLLGAVIIAGGSYLLYQHWRKGK